jgi:hypothetical protein
VLRKKDENPKGKSEIPIFLSGTDEAVVVMIVPETGQERSESDGKGTPQGGVISPLLANIFLHFAFDMWFSKNYPEGKFERYADDIIVHCDTFTEAQERLNAIEQRLKECKLQLNRSKTKIVHCQNSHKRQAPNKDVKRSFDFLGYTFKPRYVMFKGKIRVGLWVRNKYRRFRKKPWYCAYKWLVEVSKDFPSLFVHWEHGFLP